MIYTRTLQYSTLRYTYQNLTEFIKNYSLISFSKFIIYLCSLPINTVLFSPLKQQVFIINSFYYCLCNFLIFCLNLCTCKRHHHLLIYLGEVLVSNPGYLHFLYPSYPVNKVQWFCLVNALLLHFSLLAHSSQCFEPSLSFT